MDVEGSSSGDNSDEWQRDFVFPAGSIFSDIHRTAEQMRYAQDFDMPSVKEQNEVYEAEQKKRELALGPLQTDPKDELLHGAHADVDLRTREEDPETGEERWKRLRPANAWDPTKALQEVGEDLREILKS